MFISQFRNIIDVQSKKDPRYENTFDYEPEIFSYQSKLFDLDRIIASIIIYYGVRIILNVSKRRSLSELVLVFHHKHFFSMNIFSV